MPEALPETVAERLAREGRELFALLNVRLITARRKAALIADIDDRIKKSAHIDQVLQAVSQESQGTMKKIGLMHNQIGTLATLLTATLLRDGRSTLKSVTKEERDRALSFNVALDMEPDGAITATVIKKQTASVVPTAEPAICPPSATEKPKLELVKEAPRG